MNVSSVRKLHTGRTIPLMGLGTWCLTKDTAKTVADALRMGYSMIDTSGDYGTQPDIAEGINQSGVSREDFYIITKIEETDDAYEATKKNLSELQIEQADLVLIHRPPSHGVGIDLWEGLIEAKRDGLTKDIGVSNYSIEELDELMDLSDEVPVVNQVEWTPFGHSREMLQFCRDYGIIIQAYSPLTHGERLNDEVLQTIAQKYDKSAAQLLIHWCLQMGVIPIMKANQQKHLLENLDVFDFEISVSDMIKLNRLNESYSALGRSLAYA